MGDFNSLPNSHLKSACELKQIDTATRGTKVLNKVLTNMHSLYKLPKVSAPLGLSDHN